MNHTCTLDSRGLCEQCANSERTNDHKLPGMTIAEVMADRIPWNFEWPTEYELGKMENGQWD